VRLFDKSSALKIALQNHEVDIAFARCSPTSSLVPNRQRFKVVEGQGPGIRYVVFNVNTAPWNNPNMRKALAAALDRTPGRQRGAEGDRQAPRLDDPADVPHP